MSLLVLFEVTEGLSTVQPFDTKKMLIVSKKIRMKEKKVFLFDRKDHLMIT